MQIGEKIKKERIKNKISLREFARKLEISAAYLVDIEKGRRLPSQDLIQRISELLNISKDILNQDNLEMPKNVKTWIEKHPVFSKIFKFVLTQSDPVKVVEELEIGKVKRGSPSTVLAIYESELQAIALESSSWKVETGGDLFGIWGDIPIIYLATKAGPKAIRDNAHFRLDVDYLVKISTELSDKWGLRYFGDWHSHHNLGLESPSSGDISRIKRLANRNNFNEMAEFIVSFVNVSKKERIVRINPFAYQNFPDTSPVDACLIVLKGVSPIREILVESNLMSEQNLHSYSLFNLDNIKIPVEPLGRVIANEGNSLKIISERTILNAIKDLRQILSKDIEVYHTSFGHIFVVPVKNEQYIAFAIDDKWPHKILQVDWLDRAIGKSTELEVKNNSLSLLKLDQIVDCYHKLKGRDNDIVG
ncbi:MAG: helix-turn-helix transcriptional regulator [Pseudomonadota bacterium]